MDIQISPDIDPVASQILHGLTSIFIKREFGVALSEVFGPHRFCYLKGVFVAKVEAWRAGIGLRC